MDEGCFLLPVLSGKSDQARRFVSEIANGRRDDFDRAQRRCGIYFEAWFLASLPTGDVFVIFQNSADLARALSMVAESDDAFDRWFKQGLLEVTGMDLENLPEMPIPELLLSHHTSTED